MTVATTTRALPLERPASASAWSRFVSALTLLADAWREARTAERNAHKRLPFVDW